MDACLLGKQSSVKVLRAVERDVVLGTKSRQCLQCICASCGTGRAALTGRNERLFLAGHSAGGQIAAGYAQRLAGGLILLACTLPHRCLAFQQSPPGAAPVREVCLWRPGRRAAPAFRVSFWRPCLCRVCAPLYAWVHHAGVHAAAGHSRRCLLHSRMPEDLPCPKCPECPLIWLACLLFYTFGLSSPSWLKQAFNQKRPGCAERRAHLEGLSFIPSCCS